MLLLLNEIHGYYGFSGHYVIYFSYDRYIFQWKFSLLNLRSFVAQNT